jgi:molybdopterin molybdotransferase
MVSVEEAEKIILSQEKSYGRERIPFEQALGRVLAEDIKADRDLPPYNRVTVDGVAINYSAFEKEIYLFRIKATQAAGDHPIEINELDECVEIMTGAALPDSTDTVIRYEDLEIKNGTANVLIETISKGQNIHYKGKDKQEDDIVAEADQYITPALISMAAAVGKTHLLVKKLPRTVIISSGDEIVEVDKKPNPFQIRRSNNYTIKAVLQQYKLEAAMLHIPDDIEITKQEIAKCLEKYDVIILTGGISMGKFDYIPQALEELHVKKLFHKVQQRPGKPFWFGVHENAVLVFAFPGNPVSTFMCLHRYFLPWLETSLGVAKKEQLYAALAEDFTFTTALQYFLQVKLHVNEKAQILATPVAGNGSGDFANLLDSDAFMELPLKQNNFIKGEVFKIWKFA